MSELWAITVALPHEAKGILGRMALKSRTRYGHVKLYEGSLGQKDCVLLQSGMGPAPAEQATRFLLANYPVTHLVSTGYCGALVPDLQTGDAVLSTQVLALEKQTAPIFPEAQFFGLVKEKLSNKKFRLHCGPTVTSPLPVLRVEAKEKLGKETGALAVDMESFYVLKAAAAHEKIASLALRFVVDPLNLALTDTSSFVDAKSGLQALGLMREMIRKPKILLELPGLERVASRAREQLTGLITALMN